MKLVSRHGLTLIELMITVAIIGLLAGFAMPRFSASRRKAYIAAMQSDLRNLVSAQELFYADSGHYSSAISQLNVRPTAGVAVAIATGPGFWDATATHVQITDGFGCGIGVNTTNPVASGAPEGVPECGKIATGASGAR